MAWVLAKHGLAFGKTQLWPTQHYITSCKTFEALATGRHKGNDPSAKSKFDFFRKKDFFVIENLEEADRTKNEEITFWKLESWAESEKKCDWWIGITKENSNMAVATIATTQYLQRKIICTTL